VLNLNTSPHLPQVFVQPEIGRNLRFIECSPQQLQQGFYDGSEKVAANGAEDLEG